MKPTRVHSPAANVRNQWFVSAMIVGTVVSFSVGGVLFGRSHGRKHESASPVPVTTDGLPRTLKELNAWYAEPPSGQNAATYYSQGFDALKIGNLAASNVPLLGKGKLPPLGAPLSAPMKSALAAIMHSNGEALQFFAQGATYEQCRYPVDLTLGLDAPFPHVPKLKNATLLLELTAILHAEANDGKQAASDVLMALGLARSLEAEPSLLSQLVRAANVAIAVAALEQTVNRTTLPQESLSDLCKILQKMEDYDRRGEGFNRALTAERVTSITMFRTPQQLLRALGAPGANISAEQRNEIAVRAQQRDQLNEEQNYFELTFQRLMAARKEAFPDRLKTDGLIREQVTDAAGKNFAIIGLLLPGLAGPTAKEAACLAQLRLGWTAVALEQFCAGHDNRYPAALSELAPDYFALPLDDPFDGRLLRYRKNDKGYVLYSIGPDLKDDSGERMNGKAGDIVFSVVVRPKPPGVQARRAP